MLGGSLNQDLVWTLGGNSFPEHTFGFLKRFEAAFGLGIDKGDVRPALQTPD